MREEKLTNAVYMRFANNTGKDVYKQVNSSNEDVPAKLEQVD